MFSSLLGLSEDPPDGVWWRTSPRTIDHFILPCSTALAQDYYLISTIIATSCRLTLLIQADSVNKMVLVGDKRKRIYIIILHLWKLVLLVVDRYCYQHVAEFTSRVKM